MIIEGIEVENKPTVFVVLLRDYKTRLEAKGYKFMRYGAVWYLHRGVDGLPTWRITEASTGLLASGGRTRRDALKNFTIWFERTARSESRLKKEIRLQRRLIEDANSNTAIPR